MRSPSKLLLLLFFGHLLILGTVWANAAKCVDGVKNKPVERRQSDRVTEVRYKELEYVQRDTQGEGVLVIENHTAVLSKLEATSFQVLLTRGLESCHGIVFHDHSSGTTLMSHFQSLNPAYESPAGIYRFVQGLRKQFYANGGKANRSSIYIVQGQWHREIYQQQYKTLLALLTSIAPKKLFIDEAKEDFPESPSTTAIYWDFAKKRLFKEDIEKGDPGSIRTDMDFIVPMTNKHNIDDLRT